MAWFIITSLGTHLLATSSFHYISAVHHINQRQLQHPSFTKAQHILNWYSLTLWLCAYLWTKTNSTVFLRLFVFLLCLHVFSCSFVHVFLCIVYVFVLTRIYDIVCAYIHVYVWITVRACGKSRCSLAISVLIFLCYISFMERDSFIAQYHSGGLRKYHISIIYIYRVMVTDIYIWSIYDPHMAHHKQKKNVERKKEKRFLSFHMFSDSSKKTTLYCQPYFELLNNTICPLQPYVLFMFGISIFSLIEGGLNMPLSS